MPSRDQPVLDHDWEPRDPGFRPRRRTVGFLLTALAVGALWWYDRAVVPSGTPLVADWFPVALDWLFLLSLAAVGWFGVAPLVRNRRLALTYWRRLRRDRVALAAALVVAAFVLVGTVGSVLLGRPTGTAAHISQPPVFAETPTSVAVSCVGEVTDYRCHGTWRYPLGTNRLGVGMIPLLVSGASVALQVALVAAALAVPVGTAVGVTAGYLGGRVDTVLMRYVDVQRTLPAFLVYIVASFYLGRSLLLLVAVFGLLNWGGVAQLVRAETLQRRSASFVRAAESAGAGPATVVSRHLVPNVAGTVATAATRQAPLLVVTEAALSFMNLNDIDRYSWGELIAVGLQQAPLETWWPWATALAALTTTVVALSVLGDALRDVFDPRTG
jgi:peptide/nickel transport system permease protein